MKKHGVRMVFTHFLLVFLFCIASGTATAADSHPVPLSVEIVPGAEYTHTKWFVIIPMKLTPQMAVWLESAEGTFIDSIYITEKAARGNWRGGKDVSRPEALPVYFHRSGAAVAAEGSGTSGRDSEADTVSGATPKEGDQDAHKWTHNFSLEPGTYRIMVEVNSSFDYNSSFPEQKGNVNGQPSLVYAAEFEVGAQGLISGDVAEQNGLDLKPVGHGDPSGQTGEIMYDLNGMTSALEMLEEIRAAVR